MEGMFWMGKKPHTYEEVRDFVNSFNYILVSKEYFRQSDKLEMICDKGHDCSISFKSFKRKTRCSICANVNRSLNQRTPFKEIKQFVESCGATLLSNEDEYVNGKSKMRLLCKVGHEFKSAINSIKITNCGCPECKRTTIGNKLRTDGNIVLQCFIDKGLTPQFNSDFYINAQQKLPYICKNHLDEGIKYTTYTTLQVSVFSCKRCYLEHNQRENHWNWQGGVSSLTDYLRIRLNDWKYESLKKYDFKCAISDVHTKDLEVHHLYNFSDIVRETIQLLNLPIQDIGLYSKDELNSIESTFHEIHDKYGLGIPLTKEIHTLYHQIYGFNNNTIEEFNEFNNNYIDIKSMEKEATYQCQT
jgi:hypothetical protein